MPSLFDAFKQYIGDAKPGGLLNPEVPPGGPTELAKGLLGFTPVVGDAISGYDAIQSARQGDYLGAALNGVGLLPFVPAMVMPASKKAEVLEKLTAMQNGQKVKTRVAEGFVPTNMQKAEINDLFTVLTSGKQPPNTALALDVALQHPYDSRMSGGIKPSGMLANKYDANKVTDWLHAASEDSSRVTPDRFGRPGLETLYTDQKTGESYIIRMPISGDIATGKQWVSGIIKKD